MKVQTLTLKQTQEKIIDLYEDSFLIFVDENNEETDVTVNLKTSGIVVKMVYVAKVFSQNKKINISINHLNENTKSYFINRTLLGNNAKFDFCGNISLGLKANLSSGNMDVKGLVSGKNISWRSKPNLLIANKSATAVHKAILVGYDQNQMRYLESRGLGKDEIKSIIQKSFLEEAISKIPDQKEQDYTREKIGLI